MLILMTACGGKNVSVTNNTLSETQNMESQIINNEPNETSGKKQRISLHPLRKLRVQHLI